MTKYVLLAVMLLTGCAKEGAWSAYSSTNDGPMGRGPGSEFYLEGTDSVYIYTGPDAGVQFYSRDAVHRGLTIRKGDQLSFLLRYERDEAGKLLFDSSYGNFFNAVRGYDTVLYGTDISSSIIRLTDSVLDKNTGIYSCSGDFQFYATTLLGRIRGKKTLIRGHFINIAL